MNHLPKSPALAALLLALLVSLAACSDGSSGESPAARAEVASDASDSGSATPPVGSTDPTEPTEPAEPADVMAKMNGWRVTVVLQATDRYYADHRQESRIHLLPKNVAADPTANRWGDIFVLSPTQVYDPTTQERRPMPADPVAWLRRNPGVEVLREKRVSVGDHRAWQFDVDRRGEELFGDRDGGLEGDGFERLVLWQVDDTWFLAQAGTFREERGLLAPEGPDDVMRQVLDSARYEKR